MAFVSVARNNVAGRVLVLVHSCGSARIVKHYFVAIRKSVGSRLFLSLFHRLLTVTPEYHNNLRDIRV